jgi:hypothetical protein
MIGRAVPQLIDGGSLPDYPFGPEVRLDNHHFTMVHHHLWLASRLHLMGSLAAQGAALNLIFYAQMQSPVGTLPDDDFQLARLLRMDVVAWRNLRGESPGPLHKWEHCRCHDGSVRLMHPVVLQGVEQAIHKREERELSTEGKAVSMRQMRLRRALESLGCVKELIGDQVLIERMDTWLLEHIKGKRTASSYSQALDHAGKMRWFTRR